MSKCVALRRGIPAAVAALAGVAQAQVVLREGVGPGTALSNLIVSGDCRLTIVGDSISNKNSNTSIQSSTYWGLIRNWSPDTWAGIVTPTNNHGPEVQIVFPNASVASVSIRTLQDNPGARDFSYGYTRLSVAPTVDIRFNTGTNAPPGRIVAGQRLRPGSQWLAGSWFDGVAMQGDFIVFRTPEALGSCRAVAQRGSSGRVVGPPLDLRGTPSVVAISAPALPASPGDVEFLLETDGDYDESADPYDHLIWLGTRLWRTDAPGLQVDSMAVGGARLRDWLEDGPYADDAHLTEYLAATGRPNVFLIQLGANDGTFPPEWRTQMEQLIERLNRLSQPVTDPMFLLVAPYGTPDSISHANASIAAEHLHAISTQGTASVGAHRIGFISLPGMLGGPIDAAHLLDAIHPRPSGTDLLASLMWQALTQHRVGGCPADLTASADMSDEAYGLSDGVVDASDFFYFLDRFTEFDAAEADLTGSPDPNDPAYGVPDGVIDAADFFYFLDLFVQGCG